MQSSLGRLPRRLSRYYRRRTALPGSGGAVDEGAAEPDEARLLARASAEVAASVADCASRFPSAAEWGAFARWVAETCERARREAVAGLMR